MHKITKLSRKRFFFTYLHYKILFFGELCYGESSPAKAIALTLVPVVPLVPKNNSCHDFLTRATRTATKTLVPFKTRTPSFPLVPRLFHSCHYHERQNCKIKFDFKNISLLCTIMIRKIADKKILQTFEQGSWR